MMAIRKTHSKRITRNHRHVPPHRSIVPSQSPKLMIHQRSGTDKQPDAKRNNQSCIPRSLPTPFHELINTSHAHLRTPYTTDIGDLSKVRDPNNIYVYRSTYPNAHK